MKVFFLVQCNVQREEKQGTCQGDACYFDTRTKDVADCIQDNQRKTFIIFEMLTHFSVNASTKDGFLVSASLRVYHYICQFNQCNTKETHEKIWSAVSLENLCISSVAEAWRITLQEKQTTTANPESNSISTESSTVSSTQLETTLSNNSILHYMPMNTLILHCLFLIFF